MSKQRNLRRGSTGEDVRAWQRFLIEQGLYAGKVDGDFGPRTESATKEFQRRQNLGSDGIVGKRTRHALRLVQGLVPIPRRNPGVKPVTGLPQAVAPTPTKTKEKAPARPPKKSSKTAAELARDGVEPRDPNLKRGLRTDRRRTAPAFPDADVPGKVILGDYPAWVRKRAAHNAWLFGVFADAEINRDPIFQELGESVDRLEGEITADERTGAAIERDQLKLREELAADEARQAATSSAVPLSPQEAAKLPEGSIVDGGLEEFTANPPVEAGTGGGVFEEPVKRPGDLSEFPAHIGERARVDTRLRSTLERLQRERVLEASGQKGKRRSTRPPTAEQFRQRFDPVPTRGATQ